MDKALYLSLSPENKRIVDELVSGLLAAQRQREAAGMHLNTFLLGLAKARGERYD